MRCDQETAYKRGRLLLALDEIGLAPSTPVQAGQTIDVRTSSIDCAFNPRQNGADKPQRLKLRHCAPLTPAHAGQT